MTTSDYCKTLIPVGIMLLATLQKGSGFVLLLLLPLLSLFALYQGMRMLRRPEERKVRLIRLSIWLSAFALAGSVQTYWHQASRSNAEEAATAVLSYKARTGSYPANLTEAGLDDGQLRDKWRIRYSLRQGAPILSYPMSFMPLSSYEYDFEGRVWRKNSY